MNKLKFSIQKETKKIEKVAILGYAGRGILWVASQGAKVPSWIWSGTKMTGGALGGAARWTMSNPIKGFGLGYAVTHPKKVKDTFNAIFSPEIKGLTNAEKDKLAAYEQGALSDFFQKFKKFSEQSGLRDQMSKKSYVYLLAKNSSDPSEAQDFYNEMIKGYELDFNVFSSEYFRREKSKLNSALSSKKLAGHKVTILESIEKEVSGKYITTFSKNYKNHLDSISFNGSKSDADVVLKNLSDEGNAQGMVVRDTGLSSDIQSEIDQFKRTIEMSKRTSEFEKELFEDEEFESRKLMLSGFSQTELRLALKQILLRIDDKNPGELASFWRAYNLYSHRNYFAKLTHIAPVISRMELDPEFMSPERAIETALCWMINNHPDLRGGQKKNLRKHLSGCTKDADDGFLADDDLFVMNKLSYLSRGIIKSAKAKSLEEAINNATKDKEYVDKSAYESELAIFDNYSNFNSGQSTIANSVKDSGDDPVANGKKFLVKMTEAEYKTSYSKLKALIGSLPASTLRAKLSEAITEKNIENTVDSGSKILGRKATCLAYLNVVKLLKNTKAYTPNGKEEGYVIGLITKLSGFKIKVAAPPQPGPAGPQQGQPSNKYTLTAAEIQAIDASSNSFTPSQYSKSGRHEPIDFNKDYILQYDNKKFVVNVGRKNDNESPSIIVSKTNGKYPPGYYSAYFAGITNNKQNYGVAIYFHSLPGPSSADGGQVKLFATKTSSASKEYDNGFFKLEENGSGSAFMRNSKWIFARERMKSIGGVASGGHSSKDSFHAKRILDSLFMSDSEGKSIPYSASVADSHGGVLKTKNVFGKILDSSPSKQFFYFGWGKAEVEHSQKDISKYQSKGKVQGYTKDSLQPGGYYFLQKCSLNLQYSVKGLGLGGGWSIESGDGIEFNAKEVLSVLGNRAANFDEAFNPRILRIIEAQNAKSSVRESYTQGFHLVNWAIAHKDVFIPDSRYNKIINYAATLIEQGYNSIVSILRNMSE